MSAHHIGKAVSAHHWKGGVSTPFGKASQHTITKAVSAHHIEKAVSAHHIWKAVSAHHIGKVSGACNDAAGRDCPLVVLERRDADVFASGGAGRASRLTISHRFGKLVAIIASNGELAGKACMVSAWDVRLSALLPSVRANLDSRSPEENSASARRTPTPAPTNGDCSPMGMWQHGCAQLYDHLRSPAPYVVHQLWLLQPDVPPRHPGSAWTWNSDTNREVEWRACEGTRL